ncbi:hypothetical protein DINM_002338 [Dirofilaria immitis]|nr:hypothetical protein [Dirofilaria immitis]
MSYSNEFSLEGMTAFRSSGVRGNKEEQVRHLLGEIHTAVSGTLQCQRSCLVEGIANSIVDGLMNLTIYITPDVTNYWKITSGLTTKETKRKMQRITRECKKLGTLDDQSPTVNCHCTSLPPHLLDDSTTLKQHPVFIWQYLRDIYPKSQDTSRMSWAYFAVLMSMDEYTDNESADARCWPACHCVSYFVILSSPMDLVAEIYYKLPRHFWQTFLWIVLLEGFDKHSGCN